MSEGGIITLNSFGSLLAWEKCVRSQSWQGKSASCERVQVYQAYFFLNLKSVSCERLASFEPLLLCSFFLLLYHKAFPYGNAPKERNHKRKGFAPPLKVPLFWNHTSLTPPRPRCAAHRLRCACSLTALAFPRCAAFGVLAYFCGSGQFCVSVGGLCYAETRLVSLPEKIELGNQVL